MGQRAFLPTGDSDLVEISEVADPIAADDESIVAVEAFSVNRGEMILLQSGRQEPPGKDIAGRVISQAADGSGPGTGARVVAHLPGAGWAERVAVPTDRLVEIPDRLEATVAAALPLAGLTALRLIRAAGGIAGRPLIFTGAAGGVGHYFVELASHVGAKVTAVTRSERAAESLRQLGAARVLRSTAEVEGRFDLAFDAGGGELDTLLSKLHRGGTLIWFGQASLEPISVDFFALAAGPVEVSLRSFFYWAEEERDTEDLRTLVHLVATGQLHPFLGEIADWTETPRVLAAIRDREMIGNAVLTV